MQVAAVLESMKEPLHKQFLAISKRKTKILDPKKKPKNAPASRDEPLLTVEDYSKDLDSTSAALNPSSSSFHPLPYSIILLALLSCAHPMVGGSNPRCPQRIRCLWT